MFFKKQREAKKAAAEQVRRSIIDGFQGRYEAAQQNPDPADRIVKLQDISNDVDKEIAELNGDASKSANIKQKVLFWTAMPAGLAVSAVYPPALIGLAGMAGSVYGGKQLSKKFGEASKKKFLDKNKDFIEALTEQKAQALKAQDDLFAADARGIAASKNFSDVLAKVPRLREQFAAAFGKKVTEEEAAKQAPPKRWVDDPNFKFGS
jgi:hypothetical protein